MSATQELDDEQLFTLMKFKRNVHDVRLPHHNDQYMARWLKARSWKLEDAEKMYRDSMRWRNQWEVDTKLTKQYEPNEFMQKHYISGLSGYDKTGAPVIIIPIMNLDFYGILHVASRTEVIKYTIYLLERYLALAAKTGANQVIGIIDLEGFNIRHYTHRLVAEFVISLIQMYEANYPEILRKCYIINAPKVFAIAYAVVKNFLNDYTLSKIQIIKADPNKWKPVLLELIDRNQLPVHYGGTITDPDGNPKCPSKINFGSRVAKSLYRTKEDLASENEFKSTTVKKGDTFKLDFICADKGSFLNWEVQIEGGDIKFSIVSMDEDGHKTDVVPTKRISTTFVNEIGLHECAAPGTYTVIFDNTYSYFRSKKLNYAIKVVPPLNFETEPDCIAAEP